MEQIVEGDIVYITSEGKVSKPTLNEHCKKVIGVCTEHAFMELGTELYTEETRCKVGILGKLWVKTNQVYLIPGDKVKATINGVEKVTDVNKDLEYIIGIVVEPYKNGKVRVNFNKIA